MGRRFGTESFKGSAEWGFNVGTINTEASLFTGSFEFSTLLRVSELAPICLGTIQETELSLSFSLLRPRKSQHGGSLHKLTLPRCNDPKLNHVSCMLLYVDRTRPLRIDVNKDCLAIACVKPHRSVVSLTISGWLKKQLGEAGVDIRKFSAHSTRGAAASKAAAAGVSLQKILTSANWAKESTLTTSTVNHPYNGGMQSSKDPIP